MSFTTTSSNVPSSQINVTPLIDVLLVLLIIFMVIVPVTPHGLNASLPQPGVAHGATLPPIEVRLSAGDAMVPVRYRIGAQEVTYVELQPRLRALFSVREDRTLVLRADRSLSYREVAAVVGEAHHAGAGTIALGGIQP
jgi:biopolymer transport protein ExbD